MGSVTGLPLNGRLSTGDIAAAGSANGVASDLTPESVGLKIKNFCSSNITTNLLLLFLSLSRASVAWIVTYRWGREHLVMPPAPTARLSHLSTFDPPFKGLCEGLAFKGCKGWVLRRMQTLNRHTAYYMSRRSKYAHYTTTHIAILLVPRKGKEQGKNELWEQQSGKCELACSVSESL